MVKGRQSGAQKQQLLVSFFVQINLVANGFRHVQCTEQQGIRNDINVLLTVGTLESIIKETNFFHIQILSAKKKLLT